MLRHENDKAKRSAMILPKALNDALIRSDLVTFPIILCFYTGEMPPAAAKMPREPEAANGMSFGADFVEVLEQALEHNAAIHDGAIMIGRADAASHYRIVGWSYRLLPPPLDGGMPNKGSAFNSCLAMSAVANIDMLYLFSRREFSVFQAGTLVAVTDDPIT
jgi:hypothetical protein